MSTDTSDDTVEHTVADSSPTGVARCEELEGQSEPYVVHGVAIGADETTLGANGPKYWPAEELQEAAQSLVGVPLTKNHDDDRVESVVGEVVDAGFEPGVGIVFEAEVDDRELATKIARGRLEVSVHAVHRTDGRTDDGAAIVENIQFLDLSVVPRGGSPSNYVESGESPSQALASLSAGDVAGMLEDATDNESMTDDTDDTEQEHEAEAEAEAPDDESEAEVEADVDEDVQEAEADTDADEAEAEAEAEADTEDDLDEAEVEADEADADEDLEEAELREELESLRAENQELRNELESVRLEYAERLAEGSPFEAAELTEKFSFGELKAKFDEAEASLAPEDGSGSEAKPAPLTGDAESELSTSTSEEIHEIAEVKSKIEKYDEMGWDAAKAEAEERLEEIRS